MVIGNTYQISPSLFAPATTLASLIASQFREADSDVYLSALIAAGVVLFAIAVIVNALARLLVWRVSARPAREARDGDAIGDRMRDRRASDTRCLAQDRAAAANRQPDDAGCSPRWRRSSARAILLLLLGYVLVNGISYVNWEFLTTLPKPLGEPGGGMANAFVGSLIMVGLASVLGQLLGIGAGVYLAEYAGARFGAAVRFVADVLSGMPSVVIGIFGYALIVIPLGTFSALAGAFALGVIMLPIVARTTEESLRLVPRDLREAALALGIPRWRTILSVVLPTAAAGTGHRRAAGRRPGGRRDRAADLHGARQPLLARGPAQPDRRADAQHLPVRDLALRAVAPAGLGSVVLPAGVRADPEHLGALLAGRLVRR